MDEPVNEMKELANDLDSQQTQQKEKTELNPDNSQQGNSNVITKEFVKEHGLSDTFIGKPFSELAKSYKGMQAQDTKLSQQLKAADERLTRLEQSLTKQEVKEVAKDTEKEVVDEIGDPPEPMDFENAKDYQKAMRKWMDKAFEIREKNLIEKINKSNEEKYGKTIQDVQINKLQTQVFELVEEGVSKILGEDLPEDMDITEVISGWEGSLTEEELEDIKQNNIYANNPKRMAKDILLHYRASLYDKSKDSSKEKADKESDRIANNLKKQSSKYTSVSTSARDKAKPEKSVMSELAADLEQSANWNRKQSD